MRNRHDRTSKYADDAGHQKMDDRHMQNRQDRTSKYADVEKFDQSGESRVLKFSRREQSSIKLGKNRSEISGLNPKVDKGNVGDVHANTSPQQSRAASGKRNIDDSRVTAESTGEVLPLRKRKVVLGKQSEGRVDPSGETNEDHGHTPVLKDSKPTLKFKFKKPNPENQTSQILLNEEEKSLTKGQRSKRKRPSTEKSSFNGDEDADVTQSNPDSLTDGMMDASWILKKLGKDAVGKRVEVHQASDNSWHKGDVTEVVDGTSTLLVKLDDARVKTVELGKHNIRFVLKKQKRSKF